MPRDPGRVARADRKPKRLWFSTVAADVDRGVRLVVFHVEHSSGCRGRTQTIGEQGLSVPRGTECWEPSVHGYPPQLGRGNSGRHRNGGGIQPPIDGHGLVPLRCSTWNSRSARTPAPSLLIRGTGRRVPDGRRSSVPRGTVCRRSAPWWGMLPAAALPTACRRDLLAEAGPRDLQGSTDGGGSPVRAQPLQTTDC